MREFRCKSLGYRCSWKHIGAEELLADMVALHLRDVHGVQALDPDTVGRIKNAFTYASESDAAAAANTVVREYNCDMRPECTWRYVAMTQELIIEGAAAHAREKHGLHNFTREMIARVRRATHTWSGESRRNR